MGAFVYDIYLLYMIQGRFSVCFSHLGNDAAAWKRSFPPTPSMTITINGYTGDQPVFAAKSANQRLVISKIAHSIRPKRFESVHTRRSIMFDSFYEIVSR